MAELPAKINVPTSIYSEDDTLRGLHLSEWGRRESEF
jgi:hypothetical protein